mgnify:CR=1 FL=1
MGKKRTFDVMVDADPYEDEDDSLGAAAYEVGIALGLRGYDLPARWVGSGEQSQIAVTVPEPTTVLGWDRLRTFEGHGCHH